MITIHWLTTVLTRNELLLFWAIATHNTSYAHFDLNSLQAVRWESFVHKVHDVQPMLNVKGLKTWDRLRKKILDLKRTDI